VIASLYLGTLVLLVLNLPLIPMWVQILRIPYWILYPTILVLAVVGAYSVRGSLFDVWMMVGFSLVGYIFRKLDIPAAPMLMAFVLGPQAELALRQSLTLSNNSPLIFVERPISATVLALTVAVIAFTTVSRYRRRRRVAAANPTTPSVTTVGANTVDEPVK
jgi:putative tricarboxylic transport membrane protein